MLQTKDKMCDIIDTTYVYPLTTTIVAKTTSRSREVTAGRDAAPTSHPPTSIPTEGKEESLEPAQSFHSSPSGKMLPEVHLLKQLFICIDEFVLLKKEFLHKYKLQSSTYTKWNLFQMARSGIRWSSCL